MAWGTWIQSLSEILIKWFWNSSPSEVAEGIDCDMAGNGAAAYSEGAFDF